MAAYCDVKMSEAERRRSEAVKNSKDAHECYRAATVTERSLNWKRSPGEDRSVTVAARPRANARTLTGGIRCRTYETHPRVEYPESGVLCSWVISMVLPARSWRQRLS